MHADLSFDLSLPRRSTGAGVLAPLFVDGFERPSTCHWSTIRP